MGNQKYTIPETEVMPTKKDYFVAKHSKLGDKWIIIIPKEHHDTVKNMKNPLKVIVEEIFDRYDTNN
jgi:hypothetical protein